MEKNTDLSNDKAGVTPGPTPDSTRTGGLRYGRRRPTAAAAPCGTPPPGTGPP